MTYKDFHIFFSPDEKKGDFYLPYPLELLVSLSPPRGIRISRVIRGCFKSF